MDYTLISRNRGFSQKRDDQARNKETGVMEKGLLFHEMIAPMESRMKRSIWRIVRNPQMAEDTLQDALTIIWKKLHLIQTHPNPQALILKICLDSAYDALRRSQRFQRYKELDVQSKLLAQPDVSVGEILEKKRLEAEIMAAISRLPKKQARAVLLRIIFERPYDEIARILECKEETVRVQVSKGRARLSRKLSHLKVHILQENLG